MSRRRRLFGVAAEARGFESAFDSDSGVRAALILDYAGAVGGQFYDGDSNTLTFGDLHTFARASLATQRNTAGLVQFGPHNLVKQSNDFDTTWVKAKMDTPTQDVIGPDGTMSGWTLQDDSSGGTFDLTITAVAMPTTATGRFKGVVWAKKDQVNFLIMNLQNFGTPSSITSKVWFNLNTGNVGTQNGGVVSATMTAAGNDWFLCEAEWILGTDVLGDLRLSVAQADNDAKADIDGTSSIFVSRAAFYQTPMAPANDTFATTYVPTTVAAVFQHRLDHDINGDRNGLKIEHTSINSCLWSDDWTNAVYDTVTTMTVAKDQIGADGVANSASSLLATGANSLVTQSITDASIVRVFSVHIKRITGTGNIELTQDGGSTWLDIKAKINSSTYTQVATALAILANPVVGIRIVTDTDEIAVQFGSSERGIAMTSAIPTTTVTVTRAEEIISAATSNWTYSPTAGTHFVDFNMAAETLENASINHIIHHFTDGDNEIFLRRTADDFLYHMDSGASNMCSILAGTPVAGDSKMSASYSLNDFISHVDGVSIGTDVSGTPNMTPATLHIGTRSTGLNKLNGNIKVIAYYGSRLSNADQVTMTL